MKPDYRNLSFFLLAALACLAACTVRRVPAVFPSFYMEGHRGTRGNMPENTIPSMIKAIELGANVIEVDVYTSKDGRVIVTHDPHVNIGHSLDAEGRELTNEQAGKYIFHQMNYDDIRKFNVGSKYYSLFPKQKKIKAYIPLLTNLIDSVEQYTSSHGIKPVIYNIELKSAVKYDGVYNATPPVLVDAVMEVVKEKNIGKRFYLQSFDIRPLQYSHKKYPRVTLGFLTSSKNSFEENIAQLGFNPAIYSPEYKLVSKELIEKCHDNNIKIIPWTVNTPEEIKKLKTMGVDGIITDYPDYFSHQNKLTYLKTN